MRKQKRRKPALHFADPGTEATRVLKSCVCPGCRAGSLLNAEGAEIQERTLNEKDEGEKRKDAARVLESAVYPGWRMRPCEIARERRQIKAQRFITAAG